MELSLPLWPHSQTNQSQAKIRVLLDKGEQDHYIVEAPILAPTVEVDGEVYVRTERIAHVKVKDRFGKRTESYRVYSKVSP